MKEASKGGDTKEQLMNKIKEKRLQSE